MTARAGLARPCHADAFRREDAFTRKGKARRPGAVAAVAAIFAAAGVLAGTAPAAAAPVICEGELPQQAIDIPIGGDAAGGNAGGDSTATDGAGGSDAAGSDGQPDLLVQGACTVSRIGDYFYGQVNIVSGGSLTFVEPPQQDPGNPRETRFWASSVVIENGGSLAAGSDATPYGSNGNVLEIVLYGRADAPAATCIQANCGVPDAVWNGGSTPQGLPGNVTDIFYPYHDLSMHGSGEGYFGNKVLALAYGGSLRLRGYKGTTGAAAADADPTATGTSWGRLAADLKPGDTSLVPDPDASADWQEGDRIVVSPTDYLASHAEDFVIAGIGSGGQRVLQLDHPARFAHSGTAFPLADRLSGASSGFQAANQGSPLLTQGETRAAVGLLSRSIRIVSGGDMAGEPFDWESAVQKAAAPSGTKSATDRDPTYAHGGHAMFRQGFAALQIQGVEFRWLGQGGRIGHYPVHFHMARQVPAGTYVKDSAINESMTRWIVLHRSQGITLQRNVGYRSIGHGFYLEDATETDNRLYANLGVFARAAVDSPDNPRRIPGILSAPWSDTYATGGNKGLNFASDAVYPTAFWITNGWNEVIGNMAAGAGMCGACYWLLGASPNDMLPTMSWTGYAQMDQIRPGNSPLKQFYRNYCSTAMHSFMSVADGSPCFGVQGPGGANPAYVDAIANPEAAAEGDLTYYPKLVELRTATICPVAADGQGYDCSTVAACDHVHPETCAVTVLDTYTSSFNWAETNLGAIWMRGGWNMIDRLFMSDIQNGGVGLISSGDYSRSSAPLGYWSLISHSVMVGETQPNNSYASAAGPKDESGKSVCTFTGPACAARDAALSFQLSNWSTNRMLNVYDGPFYQDGNAFLDIRTSPCTDAASCMTYTVPGPRRVAGSDPGAQQGYLPNAAIGWKQPNGFYYPPAFHSRNLFFDSVDIRHFLTVPLFRPGSYEGDVDQIKAELINQTSSGIFTGFTDVDRQTVLNDDDGSLTGLAGTISVNEDPYFAAPVQTAECLSNREVVPANACTPNGNTYTPAARTSPYRHLTLAIAPADTGSAVWAQDCTNQNCAGLRLYRQYLTGSGSSLEWGSWTKAACSEAANIGGAACDWPFIRMAGSATWQRSVLTADQGSYYVDTTRSAAQQGAEGFSNTSVFEAGKTYYAYFLFAQPDSRQTYQLYVGQDFDPATDLKFIQVSIDNVPFVPNPAATGPLPAGWTTRMVKSPNSTAPDVLEITVDFSALPASIVLDPAAPPGNGATAASWGSCQPSTFCGWKEGSCGCALDAGSPFIGHSPSLLAACETACRDWSVKALDCPIGGCVGFSFTLPSTFALPDGSRRPAPQPYPASGSWAATAFSAADQAVAGACYYAASQIPTLGSTTCPPQD